MAPVDMDLGLWRLLLLAAVEHHPHTAVTPLWRTLCPGSVRFVCAFLLSDNSSSLLLLTSATVDSSLRCFSKVLADPE